MTINEALNEDLLFVLSLIGAYTIMQLFHYKILPPMIAAIISPKATKNTLI